MVVMEHNSYFSSGHRLLLAAASQYWTQPCVVLDRVAYTNKVALRSGTNKFVQIDYSTQSSDYGPRLGSLAFSP